MVDTNSFSHFRSYHLNNNGTNAQFAHLGNRFADSSMCVQSIKYRYQTTKGTPNASPSILPQAQHLISGWGDRPYSPAHSLSGVSIQSSGGV